jgi:acetyl esterase/lipase
MIIEVKDDYTYETMPDYMQRVEGAKEIVMTGEEIGLSYKTDIIYDQKDTAQHLQVIIPSIFNNPERKFPCIVFVQGSAWMPQDIHCNAPNLGKLAQRGYACAIVEYRHSGLAKFPAQIIDAKNAIRYLKEHSGEYGIDKENIIVMGDSSGGHTSCMVGMTARTSIFDEPINDENCHVKGIINLYGAVDVTLPYGYPTTVNHQLPDSPEGMLMGYNIRENMEKAKAANAREYVNEDFPPVLILHGTKDRLVYCQQSVDLYEAMKKAGKDVEFYFVKGADHGGGVFWMEEAVDIYEKFIERCLLSRG